MKLSNVYFFSEYKLFKCFVSINDNLIAENWESGPFFELEVTSVDVQHKKNESVNNFFLAILFIPRIQIYHVKL